LAFYDLHQDESGNWSDIDVLYLVKGNLTTRLVNAEPGQKLEVWGPLGNGFRPIETRHLIMVAGGIGQTPFLCLAREYLGLQKFGRECPPAQQVTFCYGARNADLLAGVDDFEQIGVNTQICTDDGSAGVPGLVTEVLEQVLQTDATAHGSNQGVAVVCCGPDPMMEAVAKVAQQWSVPCQVSLETPMACGIGICFSCVTRCKESDGSWDYKRTCVDGPVFDAEKIVWD
jgi:dihydroorotate dehydrogenase electron transfer subunit